MPSQGDTGPRARGLALALLCGCVRGIRGCNRGRILGSRCKRGTHPVHGGGRFTFCPPPSPRRTEGSRATPGLFSTEPPSPRTLTPDFRKVPPYTHTHKDFWKKLFRVGGPGGNLAGWPLNPAVLPARPRRPTAGVAVHVRHQRRRARGLGRHTESGRSSIRTSGRDESWPASPTQARARSACSTDTPESACLCLRSCSSPAAASPPRPRPWGRRRIAWLPGCAP
jgi:hypothetical protein